jgi:hypothetical protein
MGGKQNGMYLKTPQTPAFLHAAENMSVSGPGMVVAVAMHSSLSYLRRTRTHDTINDMSGIHRYLNTTVVNFSERIDRT